MVILWSTRVLHCRLIEFMFHIQGLHPKYKVRSIIRQYRFFIINQNSPHVNNRRHHKFSRQYRKVLEKPAQVSSIKEIGEGKHAAFQERVNIFSKKQEMKSCEADPYLRMKNSGLNSAPRHLPWLSPFILTLPTPANPP